MKKFIRKRLSTTQAKEVQGGGPDFRCGSNPWNARREYATINKKENHCLLIEMHYCPYIGRQVIGVKGYFVYTYKGIKTEITCYYR